MKHKKLIKTCQKCFCGYVDFEKHKCKFITCHHCGQKNLQKTITPKGNEILINKNNSVHYCEKTEHPVCCAYCKEPDLKWAKDNNKWILINKKREEHDCKYISPIIRRKKD